MSHGEHVVAYFQGMNQKKKAMNLKWLNRQKALRVIFCNNKIERFFQVQKDIAGQVWKPRVYRSCNCNIATMFILFTCFTSTETVGLLGTEAQDGHLDFHTAPELSHTPVDFVVVEVLLYVHRNCRCIKDGSPGRPPRLSHSSRALVLVMTVWRYV